MSSLFAIFGLGPMEIAVIVVIGILLFGRKLPDMGRYLGKSITEFRKGMKGLEDDLDHPAAGAGQPTGGADQIRPPQRVAATAPKFEDAPAVPPQV
ncbi:MAG: twin-arginine translocase TatA/TatE family subunit [Gemmataceae bacterium]|nr:twin-arginine translocase TatA/TatE family subunit [Gemmataceae bacterium]MCI0738638.1 twin-arginine translocase TatA/TatE family subunit [Gemmataceae bacterium]